MEKKINLVEILRYCPSGMELDCTMFEDVKFDHIKEDTDFPIRCVIENESSPVAFNKYGQYNILDKAKCVIFPKGKTTWKGFVPPCKFKKGDVLVSELGNIVLFSHIDSESRVYYHCIIPTYGGFRIEGNAKVGVGRYYECVLANEQQRQRMYEKIKCSGYKYNQQLNKLEKLVEPKFKDGDVVFTHANCLKVGVGNAWISIFKEKRNGGVATYIDYAEDGSDYYSYLDGDKAFLCMESDILRQRLATEEEKQKLFQVIKDNGYKWNAETKTLEKLVPNKFDITTLNAFESRVLVRDKNTEKWIGHFFSHYDNSYKPYVCIGVEGLSEYKQCIPYEGNEYLLGSSEECEEFYKTW